MSQLGNSNPNLYLCFSGAGISWANSARSDPWRCWKIVERPSPDHRTLSSGRGLSFRESGSGWRTPSSRVLPCPGRWRDSNHGRRLRKTARQRHGFSLRGLWKSLGSCRHSLHHRNGIRDDHRPENLELWTRPQPSGIRVSDAIEWALATLKLYMGVGAPPTALTTRVRALGGGGIRTMEAPFAEVHVNGIVSNLPSGSMRRIGTRWHQLARTVTHRYVAPVS